MNSQNNSHLIAGFFRYHREKLNYSLRGLVGDGKVVDLSSLSAFEHGKKTLTDVQLTKLFQMIGYDYKQILKTVDLSRYKIALASYSVKYESCPFRGWESNKLDWYDAYNKTKHNRNDAFNLATLENCLNAVCANIIMFCVRYSPYLLYNENDVCSNLVRNTFDVRIENNEDVYISIMAQYFPSHKALETEDVNRKLTVEEYEEIENFVFKLNIKNGYLQDLENNEEQYVPNF